MCCLLLKIAQSTLKECRFLRNLLGSVSSSQCNCHYNLGKHISDCTIYGNILKVLHMSETSPLILPLKAPSYGKKHFYSQMRYVSENKMMERT